MATQRTQKDNKKKDQKSSKREHKEARKNTWKLADCVSLIDYTGKPTGYKINAVLFVYNLMQDYRNGLRK